MNLINPYILSTAPPPPSATDTYYNDVSLLLHCDGSNGSTTFTDNSTNAFTVTPIGNAQISTTSPKFGTGAALFDGSSDGLSIPASDAFAFGYGDFTVEYWMKNVGTPARQNIMGVLATGGWNAVIYDNRYYWQTSYFSANLFNVSAATLLDGNWHHVAHSRNGFVHRFFIDGVLIGTYSDITNYSVNTSSLVIGFENTYGYYNGRMDDIRITKGIGRYTAAFTIPSEAFPDAAPDVNYNYKYVNYSFKQYNQATATTPSGIIDNDLLFFMREYDFYNSDPTSLGFTSLQLDTTGGVYRGIWYRVAASLGSTLTLPQYSLGPLLAIRKFAAGTATIVDNKFGFSLSSTSITIPAMSGDGMLYLLIEAHKNTTIPLNQPTGWSLQNYFATWLGGNFSNSYIYKKVNDGNPTTITTTSTCNIYAMAFLLN